MISVGLIGCERISREAPTRLSSARLAAFSIVGLALGGAGLPLSVYLPPFYAQSSGLGLALIGTIFMISRLWNAISDPLIGLLSDGTQGSFGRRKPWIVVGGVLFIVAAAAVFMPGPHVSPLRLAVSLFALYLGWSMVTIPLYAWSGDLSDRYHDRTRVQTYLQTASATGLALVLLIPALLDWLGDGEPARKIALMGWFAISTLAIGVLVLVLSFQERMPPARASRNGGFGSGLALLASNTLVLRVMASDFFVSLGQGFRGAMFVFFVSFYMGLPQWSALLFLIQFIFGIFAAPIWLRVGRRLGKHRTVVAGEITQIVINLTLLLLSPGELVPLIALTVAQGLAQGSGNLMLRAMIADVADLHQLQTSEERSGLLFSIFNVTSNAALAIALGVAFPLLAWLGFIPGAHNSPRALEGLHLFFGLGPALGHAASALLIQRFPLDEHRHAEILAALSGRDGRGPVRSSSFSPAPVRSFQQERSMSESNTRLEIRPVTGRIGAEIDGIKLSGHLAAEGVAAIREALLKHKVIFFRGQTHLDDSEQEAFAALLGEPVAHPTVPTLPGTKYSLGIASHYGGRTNSWHSDVTFVQTYPQISILRAEVIPAAGGDTVWANTVTALSDLSPELRDLATRLWAVHTNDFDYAATRSDADSEYAKHFKKTFAATVYETEHPLVRVHPETGEHALVLGHFVKKITGLSSTDSARLVELLQGHITRPENTVRWRWTPGDVAIWDNRATQHYGVADYGNEPRELHRVTVAGDVPVGTDGRRSVARKAPGIEEPVSRAA